jgi:hypothetical protein
MAQSKPGQPTWWLLFMLAPLMLGLLMLAHRLAPSPGWREFLEVGVVFFIYGLVALWQ